MMLTEFIKAGDLKQKYAIYGNFYQRKINAETVISGRNILEIVAHDICPLLARDIDDMLPDAVMIMMNPGSSQPLEGIDHLKPLSKTAMVPQNLVATKPDTTQYQVMRVMHYMNWQHVRVINLSDLREAKSPLFIKKYMWLEAEFGFDLHSIFAARRADELARVLKRKNAAPIINGWGVSEKLDALIARALPVLPNSESMFGIVKPELEPKKYFHPLPTLQRDKNLWVENIVKQLTLK
ncbi:MAG: DUF1643 domain-containing protein [Hyphomicrobiales bacterium]|nr:MAG: DUF1643 domain-containing protein [Hyphomicrobiales bacterium]